MRHALFVVCRDLWIAANAGAFVLGLWYASLPPIEGTHPGFLIAFVWVFLLFPGVVAMVGALALINLVAPDSLSQSLGPVIFFGVWAGGALLTYYFWFAWLPRRFSSRTGGYTLLELLFVVTIISIISAIAIPALLRSRMAANETAAIGDIREVLANRRGNPADFMGAPINCSSVPASFSTSKAGYVRGCTAGVLWAIPVTQGKTGLRGFGGDATGRICYANDGSIPNMTGACETLK